MIFRPRLSEVTKRWWGPHIPKNESGGPETRRTVKGGLRLALLHRAVRVRRIGRRQAEQCLVDEIGAEVEEAFNRRRDRVSTACAADRRHEIQLRLLREGHRRGCVDLVRPDRAAAEARVVVTVYMATPSGLRAHATH